MQVKSGSGDEIVVRKLISDMNLFSEHVRQELQSMLNRTETLGDSWKDPQYMQFREFIYELVGSLKRDLDIFDEAANHLERKVNLY